MKTQLISILLWGILVPALSAVAGGLIAEPEFRKWVYVQLFDWRKRVFRGRE